MQKYIKILSKRVVAFLSIVDSIPDGAEFLYNKPLVFEESEEEKAQRIITGEVKLSSIEQVYYEVDDIDFREIVDIMRLTATERITKFIKEQTLIKEKTLP